ncbi:hypothetical protein [Salinarimonas sp.]|uniref:hypothetical protein n=1 Tax=Salinarimonas sp. TaxID=2766526 RepID=UPI00391DFB4B
MSDDTIAAVTEDIYKSLEHDNEDIDRHIARLKQALAAAGRDQAAFDPARLPQSNRSGRKTMQSYFRQRGVKIVFES